MLSSVTIADAKGNDTSYSAFAAAPKLKPKQTRVANSDSLPQKQVQNRVKWRILSYVKAIIKRTENHVSFVSQQKLAKALKLRKKTVGLALKELVTEGRLELEVLPNGLRSNPKHFYRIGNPTTRVLSSLFNGQFLDADTGRKYEERKQEKSEELKIMGLDFWDSGERLDVIDFYLRSGLVVTPLVEEGKLPPKNWTKEYLSKISREELLETFYKNPNYNVGCWMPANLICVEVDDLEEFWKLNGREDYDTLTATSGKDNRRHYYMWHSGNLGSGSGIRKHSDGTSILDYKTNGSLMVLPPSIHKTGRQYEWINLTEPIDAPDIVHELYQTRENLAVGNPIKRVLSSSLDNGESLINGSNLNESKQRNESKILTVSEDLYEGNRYNKLFRLGRALRWRRNFDQVTAELHRLNRIYCKPELSEKRMQKLLTDVKFGRNTPEFSEKIRAK